MRDGFSRNIEYLRISVTDRCNLRCTYCMPEHGVQLKRHDEILTLEEIGRVVDAVAPMGISKIRLTGGEPLARKGLPALVKRIKANPLIKDIAVTTNGTLLAQYAGQLKRAGLDRVNISLDTLDGDRYRQITRRGDISQVHQGIAAALAAELDPVKINVVVIKGVNEHEIVHFAGMTLQHALHVRFIELMPIGESDAAALSTYLPAQEIKKIVEDKYQLSPVLHVQGSGPAKYYQIPGAKGTVGFIGAISEHFCHACNRLRLTADGKLRPCLQKSTEFDLLQPLRNGASLEELRQLVAEAIRQKPKEHDMELAGWGGQERKMSQIGG